MKIPFLKSGDKVGIVCTARSYDHERLQYALPHFEKWGLQVKIGKTVGAVDHQYAGTDALRAQDLQEMLDDPELSAIVCAKGGYGTVRILDQLNLDKFVEKPKWITGFSDVTALHAHIHQLTGLPTMHAPLLSVFKRTDEQTIQSFQAALFGEPLTTSSLSHPFNRTGEAEAVLVGGNLSVLFSVLGSVSDLDTRGKILFMEDLDEYLYHTDRMMVAMKRAGKLSEIKGLIIGGFTKNKDNDIPFGKTAEEIILEHTAEFDYPVAFGFPCGHVKDNRTLLLGMEAKMRVNETGMVLTF